ncbi:MAG TPA: D-2-hydroxyacid dehydrogenase [Terriglobales bacterium]|nr:D-2-hydroxyacid dehydrogenase [Terriglobales bacterium]
MAQTSASRRVRVFSVIHHGFSLWHAPDWLKPRLERDFPQLEIRLHDNYDDLERWIGDAEIFLGWSLRGPQVKAARKLRWIHSTAAAVHQLMSPELAASDIMVTNARSVHGPVVAEHALALIFAASKRLSWCAHFAGQKHWAQNEIWDLRPLEIAGATLAVIGLGSIGEPLARNAAALGMRVLAVREHPERGPGPAHEVFGPAALSKVLPASDFIVLAAPVTAHTENLIAAPQLAQMKPTAWLINVSRGSLIDEPDLLRALRERKIGGAALDVFHQEPLPAESEFWRVPNLLITPHTAGLTEKMWERQYALLGENMRRFFAGRPLLNLVDKSCGY